VQAGQPVAVQLDPLLMGSTAQGILLDADRPVLAVKP
jgi:hypothetical protein